MNDEWIWTLMSLVFSSVSRRTSHQDSTGLVGEVRRLSGGGEDKTLRDGVSSRFLRNVSMVTVEFVHRSRIDILRSGRINLFIRNSRSVYLRRKSSRVLRAYRGKRDIAPFIHCV